MGILEKISEIEKEIARTQKNKGKLTGALYLLFFFCNQLYCPIATSIRIVLINHISI